MIAPKILESLLFNSSSLLTIHTWRVVKFWWKNTNRWRLPVLLVEPVACAIICLGYCESWYSSRFLVLLDVLSNMMAITMNLKFSFFFTIWTFWNLWPQIRITCGKYGHVPKDVFMTFTILILPHYLLSKNRSILFRVSEIILATFIRVT